VAAVAAGVTKHIAAAPHRFDVVIAASRLGELFAQLAEEYIDDLKLRLVHSVIEPVKKHFLREDGTLAQTEKLEDAILFAGDVNRLILDRDNPGIEIDGQLACSDRRFGVVLGRADDRLNENCVICFELGQARAPRRNKRSANMQRFG